MPLEAQNRRKTAHFIASCGRAYRHDLECDTVTHMACNVAYHSIQNHGHQGSAP